MCPFISRYKVLKNTAKKLVISLNHIILFPYSMNMKLILENIGQEHKGFFVACNLLQTISKHAVFFFNQSEAKVKPAMTWFTYVVFPRLAPCTMFFPALDAGCMFSRAWYLYHFFPCVRLAARFPALGTLCDVFPR